MARSRSRNRDRRRRQTTAPLAPRPQTPSRRVVRRAIPNPYRYRPVLLPVLPARRDPDRPRRIRRNSPRSLRRLAQPAVIATATPRRRLPPPNQRVRNPASVRAATRSGAIVRIGPERRVTDVRAVSRRVICLERRKRREELFRAGIAGRNRKLSPGFNGYQWDALSKVRC